MTKQGGHSTKTKRIYDMTIYLDEILEVFDDYLDGQQDSMYFGKLELSPSEVLRSMSHDEYLRQLNAFIEDKYEQIGDDEYISLNSYDGDDYD